MGTQLWETPVGYVTKGMETIRNLNNEYGDMPPWGHGPEQPAIRRGGEKYIKEHFPALDQVNKTNVLMPLLNLIHCSLSLLLHPGEVFGM